MSNRMIKTRILLLATALLICESCSQKKGTADLVEQNASSSVDAQQNDGPADTILIKSHLTALTKTKSSVPIAMLLSLIKLPSTYVAI